MLGADLLQAYVRQAELLGDFGHRLRPDEIVEDPAREDRFSHRSPTISVDCRSAIPNQGLAVTHRSAGGGTSHRISGGMRRGPIRTPRARSAEPARDTCSNITVVERVEDLAGNPLIRNIPERERNFVKEISGSYYSRTGIPGLEKPRGRRDIPDRE